MIYCANCTFTGLRDSITEKAKVQTEIRGYTLTLDILHYFPYTCLIYRPISEAWLLSYVHEHEKRGKCEKNGTT